MKYLFGALAGAGAAAFVILWTAVPDEDVYATGYSTGYQKGLKDALRTNPVSDDLEFVCAGLWFGKHGPIYYQMRKEYEKRTQPN
jgi:hypothetical protein